MIKPHATCGNRRQMPAKWDRSRRVERISRSPNRNSRSVAARPPEIVNRTDAVSPQICCEKKAGDRQRNLRQGRARGQFSQVTVSDAARKL